MIDLQIKDKRGNVIIHKLGAGKHVLGKSLSSDIVLMDHYTSRHHADIIVTDTKIMLIDFNSTNGIWIDGARADVKVELEFGCVFRIGMLRLLVEKSKFNFSVKQGRPYSIKDIESLQMKVEKAKILDFGQHPKFKEKTG